jgi:D-alanine-D-alanine ligase
MKIMIVQNSASGAVIQRFGRPCVETYGAKTIELVADSLREYGHDVLVCEGDTTLLPMLEGFMSPSDYGLPSGMVFNMAYGIQGDCRYTHVPAMLEMAGVPYTGSSPLGHALALDKVVTKELLLQSGLPTPRYAVMMTGDEPILHLRYPLVVKPRHESTSFGLKLVHSRADLKTAVQSIVSKYAQGALVEEYIEGREFCVGLLGNGSDLQCFPVLEQDFTGCGVRMMTFEVKFHREAVEPQKVCPAPIDEDTQKLLHEISAATFNACQCKDYARVDLRLDESGKPYILEINSMASLGAGGSYVAAAVAAGYTYAGLVNRIVDVAHLRYFGTLPDAVQLEHSPARSMAN